MYNRFFEFFLIYYDDLYYYYLLFNKFNKNLTLES